VNISKVVNAFLYEGKIFLFYPISFPHPFPWRNQILCLKIQKKPVMIDFDLEYRIFERDSEMKS